MLILWMNELNHIFVATHNGHTVVFKICLYIGFDVDNVAELVVLKSTFLGYIFRYDATKSMESLEDSWVSRANALQRKGRAGRVASGVCFHLFTSHCFQHQLAEQQLPEIQRVPLEQLCLRYINLFVLCTMPTCIFLWLL